MSSDVVLEQWTFVATSRCSETVVPDGCQDVIIKVNDDHSATSFITDLESTAYTVDIAAGTRMIGLRLKPGTCINTTAMRRFTSNHDAFELLQGDQLDEFCDRSTAVSESLECLGSQAGSVQDVANRLGVSVRTLQRTVKSGTGVTPQFWMALARVRCAGRSLHQFDRLVDAAIALGYSDQSHLTRELKRWLGITPSQITADTDVYARLCDSGYF